MKTHLLSLIVLSLLLSASSMAAHSEWFESLSFSVQSRRELTANKYQKVVKDLCSYEMDKILELGIAPQGMAAKLIRGFMQKACEDHNAKKGPSKDLLKEYFNNLIAIFGDFHSDTGLKAEIVLEFMRVNQVDAAIFLANQLKDSDDAAFFYCHPMMNEIAFFHNPSLDAFMRWHSCYVSSSKLISRDSLCACLSKADDKTKASFKC